MRFWLISLAIVLAAAGVAVSGINEYFFFAAFVVLTYVVLATAWNILGGYAGYVNFGTSAFFGLGAYTAVVLFKWLGAPLAVQITAGAAMGALLGFGVGMLTLRLRGIFFAIATVAVIFIMETLMINWRYVGGATGLQLLRPEAMAPFASYTRMLFVVMALMAVAARYIGSSLALGDYRIPYRMLVAFGVALVLTFALTLYLSKTFTGRAIKAVAQDEPALRLMGVNPVRIKQWAFGIATGVSALAGAMLIIVGPVEPALDRVYIGRTFCVVVLAGLGSMTGTLAAGLILGISESIVLMFFGASWAPAVAFGLLLVVLGIRPQGLFGR